MTQCEASLRGEREGHGTDCEANIKYEIKVNCLIEYG